MDTIDKQDVTERAIAGGWVLPDGWTVTAEISPDYDIDADKEYDCYTPTQLVAWHNNDWQFVMVCVFVQDADGRDWGRSIVGSVEHGYLPMTNDADELISEAFSFTDALESAPGMYGPVREYDMIGEALRDATAELERFGTPIIVEPDTNYSGL